jgi:hypothetical protein
LQWSIDKEHYMFLKDMVTPVILGVKGHLAVTLWMTSSLQQLYMLQLVVHWALRRPNTLSSSLT